VPPIFTDHITIVIHQHISTRRTTVQSSPQGCTHAQGRFDNIRRYIEAELLCDRAETLALHESRWSGSVLVLCGELLWHRLAILRKGGVSLSPLRDR
jgi:hypothetical protein